MNILLVCQYFWPESFRVNDLAISLCERGHEVTVLTGKPNYPQGVYFEGYSMFGQTRETYKGVSILRIPIPPRGCSKFQLFLNYASFAIVGAVLAPFQVRRKCDVILVFSLSPIFMAIPALVLKVLGRGPVFLWLQDLWPESVSATGAVQSNLVMRVLRFVCAHIHRSVDLNLISSAGFAEQLDKMGVHAQRIHYLPNFAEDSYQQLSEHATDPVFARLPNSAFRVMFAGNVGEAQDFPMILKAAELTKDSPLIQWLIVGDGRALSWVKDEVARRGLQGTVHLVGRFPVEEMPRWMQCADIMLVTLRAELIFSLTLPSKVQSCMAAAKPIVAALDGEASRVIREAKCGICVPAGDSVALAQAVREASRLTAEDLRQLGCRGRDYFNQHFEKRRILGQLESLMENTAKRNAETASLDGDA